MTNKSSHFNGISRILQHQAPTCLSPLWHRFPPGDMPDPDDLMNGHKHCRRCPWQRANRVISSAPAYSTGRVIMPGATRVIIRIISQPDS